MRTIMAAMAALAVMVAGAACEKKPAPIEGPQKVVAVGSSWYGHLPVWAGIERGIFHKHGFKVEWRFINKSMDRLNAISSGEAQFASLGEIAMLSAMAHGNRRFYWVGAQDIAPGFEGMVARPGIDSFAGLKGKKIGFPFGSSVDLTARMLLRQNGLDPASDVELVNLEVGDVPAVFRAGNVDAALVWEPGFSELKAVSGATVLGMDTDTIVYTKFKTMTGPDVLVMSKEWADQDRGRAKKFMAAYFEALTWVAKNGAEAALLAAEGNYIRQDKEKIAASLGKFIWQGAADQGRVMSEEGMFAQADYVSVILHEEMKAIPQKPPFRQWVDPGLLPGGQEKK